MSESLKFRLEAMLLMISIVSLEDSLPPLNPGTFVALSTDLLEEIFFSISWADKIFTFPCLTEIITEE